MDRLCGALVAFGLLVAATLPRAVAGFIDPLDLPAQTSPLAARAPVQAVAHADRLLVAVGQRGHIVVSADGGTTWKQAIVPVSSDLTAVHFVDGQSGWAVGHDGVVLHSTDGGRSWSLQLDGRRANDLLLAHMQRVAAADPSSTEKKALLHEAQRFHAQGPDKPFLDVWFSDVNNGFVVGAYNMIFRTTDGGVTWTPWFDRTDNPKLFNLYAVHPAGGGLYIAAEGGLVLRLDPGSERFIAQAVPYKGSFFGVAGNRDNVLVFGLRGNAYRSDDGGRSWTKADAGLAASIVSATTTRDGTLLLADVGGRVTATKDVGRTFKGVALSKSVPIAGLVESSEGKLVLGGPRGLVVADWPGR
jgi:photosystem II stability/assembly factor-like uncharacterized protein